MTMSNTKAELVDIVEELRTELEGLEGSDTPARDARPERSLPDRIAEWFNDQNGTSYTGDNILVREVAGDKVYYVFRGLPPGERIEVYAIPITEDGRLVDHEE